MKQIPVPRGLLSCLLRQQKPRRSKREFLIGDVRQIAMRFLLTAFLSLVHPALSAETLNIPADSQTILKSGEWTPTPAQAQRAIARIQAFLQEPEPSDQRSKPVIDAIVANKIGYRVQFIGARRNERDIIVCNFFPAKTANENDPFSDWRERQVVVDDGGFAFWLIEYDPATDSCAAFQVNGDG